MNSEPGHKKKDDPFGMEMPGRTMENASGYRYGFNGKEHETEWTGTSSHYDFGARIYDGRIGRWLAVDMLAQKYPGFSPYLFSGDSPLLFKDIDGNEWVNAHDADVRRYENELLENPENKRTIRKLERAKEHQAEVNKILNNLRQNDIALFEYIDKLTVSDPISHQEVEVKVRVNIAKASERGLSVGTSGISHRNQYAETSYGHITSNGSAIHMRYESLDGTLFSIAPINSRDEIGFDMTLFETPEWADIYLANEAGDVMFRMEFPIAAFRSGSDAEKINSDGTLDREKYLKTGSAGDYSKKVEETYKKRRTDGSGKSMDNNPYPLKK